MIEHLRESAGKFVSIGSRFSISRDTGGGLKLREQQSLGFNQNELPVNLTGRAGDAEFAGAILSWQFATGGGNVRPATKSGCEYFDAAKVGSKIILPF